MKDDQPINNSLISKTLQGVSKVGGIINITNKIVLERTEEYFNLAFYLINSQTIKGVTENFYQEILKNPLYLQNENFFHRVEKFPEDFNKALNYFQKTIDLQPNLAI